MNTGGHGNDGLMIAVPIGVCAIVVVILAGGPANALEFVNDAVRDIVYDVTTLLSAWF
jgi:hypothetical protein